MAKTAVVTQAPTQTFHIGNLVTITSQANGSTLIKPGTIVAIVPPNTELWRFLQTHEALCEPHYDHAPIEKGGRGRKDISYLVAVSVQTRAGTLSKRQRLYWPRVKNLRRAEDTTREEGT